MTELNYLRILEDLMTNGDARKGRNGLIHSMFGAQMTFHMDEGFPILTTKKVHWKSVVVELLWFLRGSTNVKYLHDHGVTIWDEWADENGDLGPVYGAQWRSWPAPNGETIDQIANLIEGLKNDPFSRRHIVSAWNPAEIDNMALPPCHCLFQFHVTTDGHLNCQLYQRSADWFLGVPFNIASYSLLLHIIAAEVGLTPGKFVHTFGDYHLYENHLDAAETQLGRIEDSRKFPKLEFTPKPIFEYEPSDFKLIGYNPHPAIKAPVSA